MGENEYARAGLLPAVPKDKKAQTETQGILSERTFFLFFSHYSTAERGPWDWLCRLPWGGHTRRELSWAWVFHPFCRAPNGQWWNAGALLASWLPVNKEGFSHNSLTDNICAHLAIVGGCLWEISLPQGEHACFFSRPDGHLKAISSNLTCAPKGNAPQCRWGPDSLFGPAWVFPCSFPKLQVCRCSLLWKCFCALLPSPCPHIYPPHTLCPSLLVCPLFFSLPRQRNGKKWSQRGLKQVVGSRISPAGRSSRILAGWGAGISPYVHTIWAGLSCLQPTTTLEI